MVIVSLPAFASMVSTPALPINKSPLELPTMESVFVPPLIVIAVLLASRVIALEYLLASMTFTTPSAL